MVWNVHNPWLKLDLRARISLSLRGLAQIKKAGVKLPPLVLMSQEEADTQQPAPTIISF